jgi:dolichol-phosphate mannosyltransferase
MRNEKEAHGMLSGHQTEVAPMRRLGVHCFRPLDAQFERVWQFTRFCVVGGSGVFIDMAALYLLADPSRLGLDITFSKICAAEIALINNFIWNELWTFRTSLGTGSDIVQGSAFVTWHILARRFLLFHAICGIGIGLAVFLLHLFHTWLGWNLYLSNLLAIVLVTLWNFGMNARWNWGTARRPAGIADTGET